MKKYFKTVKVISITLIILTVLISILLISIGNDARKMGYSTYSNEKEGVKALYLLSEKMGYNAIRYKKSSRFLPDGVIMVAILPQYERMNDPIEKKHLENWLFRGNSMILIDEKSNLFKYDIINERNKLDFASGFFKGSDNVYGMGEGFIVFFEKPKDFTNYGIKDYTEGINFIKALDALKEKTVYFNEYYHGLGRQYGTVFDILGSAGRIIFIQLLLGLLLYFLILSARFGKPIPVLKNVKRMENENLFALSNIYKNANAKDIVLKIYLEKFKKQISKILGFIKIPDDNELKNAVLNNKFLYDKDVHTILEKSKIYISNKKFSRSEFKDIIYKIEKIGKELM